MYRLNHVAFVVRNVDTAAAALSELGIEAGEAETFPAEGTKEIYMGKPEAESGLLLLMEPIGKGAYQRALEKRGPGLHHIAIDVSDLNKFVESLEGTGWFLLPQSLRQAAELKQVWLGRPGFPALIEVKERADHGKQLPPLVERMGLPVDGVEKLLPALGVEGLEPSEDGSLWLQFRGRKIAADAFAG